MVLTLALTPAHGYLLAAVGTTYLVHVSYLISVTDLRPPALDAPDPG